MGDVRIEIGDILYLSNFYLICWIQNPVQITLLRRSRVAISRKRERIFGHNWLTIKTRASVSSKALHIAAYYNA